MEKYIQLADTRQRPARWVLIVLGVGIVGGLLLFGLLTPTEQARVGVSSNGRGVLSTVLALALPTFLAGVFSFLSPCTLPILPAYFAFTFQARRQQIALMTLAFFLGLATTMTLFGASFSLLGRALNNLREMLTFWGGLLIIGLGIASILGKGFAGVAVQRRPSTTFFGMYLYGMTFAIGWSACIGPILGALLTLLAAQGAPVIAGGVLASIYALGLALPLFIVAVFFNRLGTGSRAWSVLRGRGFSIKLFGRTLHLHTTSILSGILLIVIGYLLATGQLIYFSQQATQTQFGEWALAVEDWLSRVFRVGY